MAVGRFEKQFLSDSGFKTSATAGQFYSLPSIVERMARSRTGLWWNIARNLGYLLALRNFGDVGFDPESSERVDLPRGCPEPVLNSRSQPCANLRRRDHGDFRYVKSRFLTL